MNLVERAKGILLAPKAEWPKIAAEPMTVQEIYTGWVMILGAIGPLAVLLSTRSLPLALGQYAMMLAITALVAWIVDLLAPSFGGEKDFVAALKLSAFSYTAAFVAGVAGMLGVLGAVIGLAAAVYAWYTFFLGAPVLRKCDPAKALPFTIVVVLAGMALGFLFATVLGTIGLAPQGALPG